MHNRRLENASSTTPLNSLACALIFTSGRRASEILNGRSLLRASDTSVHSALFTGQLKTRSPEEYLIPLLVPYDVFDKAYRVLREKQSADTSTLTNDQIHTRYNSPLNVWLKRNYVEIPGVSLHKLRALYARIVNEAFDVDSLSFSRVAMLALGHKNMEQSLHYQSTDVKNFAHCKPKFGPLPRLETGSVPTIK